MDLDVVFLGTGGASPTAGRGMPAQLIRRGGERILVDCGEGTQRQMMRSCGLHEIDIVLITHAHMDHYMGLPGMLKTFALRERERPLEIIGPPGFKRTWKLLDALTGRLTYDLHMTEVGDGWIDQRDGYILGAFATEHSVPSVGYVLDEDDRPGRFDVETARSLGVAEGPAFGQLQRGETIELDDGTSVTAEMVVGDDRAGRLVVITGDTRATEHIRDVSTDADLLVHEATFSVDEAERAAQTRHATSADAALTAAAANVQMLAVTHVSNRHLGSMIRDEAREYFANTVCPRDFDVIEIPYRDNGEPHLIRKGAQNARGAARRDQQTPSDGRNAPAHAES